MRSAASYSRTERKRVYRNREAEAEEYYGCCECKKDTYEIGYVEEEVRREVVGL